jgi:hypothetical protein
MMMPQLYKLDGNMGKTYYSTEIVSAPQPVTGTVSGSIVTGAEGNATLELLKDGVVISTATAAVTAADKVITGTYCFDGVVPGDYTLKVSMTNHVTREYAVTVESGAVTLDTKIHLIGDIDGNGKINAGDVAKLNAHLKGTNKLTDAYMLLCANVNGGSLNMGDTASVYAHIKGTKKLF